MDYSIAEIMNEKEYKESLLNKVKILYETIWNGKIKETTVTKWLGNFETDHQLSALYLLSNFMYFDKFYINELLKGMYRDLFKYPIVADIRKKNMDTTNMEFIEVEYEKAKSKAKFIPLGGISESAHHLVYPLRQQTPLQNHAFLNLDGIFKFDKKLNDEVLKFPEVDLYIFFDDFCGTGTQVIKYNLEEEINHIRALNPNAKIYSFFLFATDSGIETLERTGLFDRVESVILIDDTFKVFHSDSRVLNDLSPHIDQNKLKTMCETNGRKLMLVYCLERIENFDEALMEMENSKLGFKNSQLLIGFEHNVPDNTLPIIWYNEKKPIWLPVFPRICKN